VRGLPLRTLLLRFGVVLVLVWFDQWSKTAVFEWLGSDGRRPLLGTRWLSFASSCNFGAAFGQFDQFPRILVVGRIAACGFLVWLLLRTPARPRLSLWAMVLVLAGALGNLIDNLGTGCEDLPGRTFRGVRDFILVYWKPLIGVDDYFPAFNVADSCITVGAVLWILAGLLHRDPPTPAEGNPDAAPSVE
jgi:signal peptidase II